MKDEVLQKALAADSTVIPRYDIILPDGTKVAENVRLVLKNNVLTVGTPLNKQSLLKDATAAAYNLTSADVLPDDVLLTIRRSQGYCPKIKITSLPDATIFVQNAATGNLNSYTVPSTGEVVVDVLAYSTFKIWASIGGLLTPYKAIDVDATKLYTVDISNFMAYCKLTVADEIGATVQAVRAGFIVKGVVKADKTCTLALPRTGTWYITGKYSDCNSRDVTLSVTETMQNTTTDKTLDWTKIVINIDAGSTVTISQGSTRLSGVSVNGVCTFWLPALGTWSVTATLGDKTVSNTFVAREYESYTFTLRYS